MEDAATAEISRAQIWQWLHHNAELSDGRTVTPALFRDTLEDEVAALDDPGRLTEATDLFAAMSLSEAFEEFLTLPAYRLID